MISNSDIQYVKQRFGIIGNSPLLNRAIEIAMYVAPTDMAVLVTGESGSGKESFSKIIHHLSHRKHGPFIAINCGAIPEGTIDSELFGHEKGAFTGASDTRKGYFEVTSGGTIFLDEIGEMPLSTQARLLRVLENGEFIKVGSSKVQKTDVRVVAATNVRLLDAISKGKFREDLYYRLNTVPLFVPPLRERGRDSLLLFRKFASDFAEKYHTKPIFLTEDGQETLLDYRFPGNIRQLKNLVEQMSVLETGKVIDSRTLDGYMPTSQALVPISKPEMGGDQPDSADLEMLYKIIFELKKELGDLKEIVARIIRDEHVKSPALLAKFTQLTSEDSDLSQKPKPTSPLLLESGHGNNDSTDESQTIDIDRVEELQGNEESESLSLERNEKELIIKALKKNGNRRKRAAQELGISERTLYRKIKQYEIED
ncbi:sigma-54-dependent Fis family transcriptional regulator [Fulvitalea axinellae]|uniref:Sigma-54-dependent Fis family transcriptional regulator n=1 Tax=Fulvitalea axinellae TaxID=1182444 RepID=A0AAU9CK52_9BACT|nr:sigma-54-dependent Fis family transcriptional regulator [Fulvitalea axinellae]